MRNKSRNSEGLPKDFWQWELIWEARSLNWGDEKDLPWLVCVTCSWHDLFLVRKAFAKEPTPTALWNILIKAMKRPEMGEPHRPKVLMVSPDEGWEALQSKLARIGTELVITSDLDYPDGFPEWTNEVWMEWERRKKGK